MWAGQAGLGAAQSGWREAAAGRQQASLGKSQGEVSGAPCPQGQTQGRGPGHTAALLSTQKDDKGCSTSWSHQDNAAVPCAAPSARAACRQCHLTASARGRGTTALQPRLSSARQAQLPGTAGAGLLPACAAPTGAGSRIPCLATLRGCGRAVGHHTRRAGARLSPHLHQAQAQASQKRAGRAVPLRPERAAAVAMAPARPPPSRSPAAWLSGDSTVRHGETSKPALSAPKPLGSGAGEARGGRGGVPQPGCCREEQMLWR